MAEKYWWQEDEKDNGQGDKSQLYWWQSEDVASSVADNFVNRMNTYLGNHNSYITDYTNRYSSRKGNYEDAYVSDSAKWMETVQNRNSALDTEANEILSYMDQYKGYLNEDWMKQVRDTITSTRDVHKSIYDIADKDNQYWSSFGTNEMVQAHGSAEEAYKYSQRSTGYSQKYAGSSLEEIAAALESLEDGEEKDWLAYSQASILKNTLSQNDDWETRSEYKSTQTGDYVVNPWTGMVTDYGFDDVEYDYINRNETARNLQLLNDIWSNAAFLGLDKSYLSEMTDDEIQIYNYLYDPNDKTEANEYLAHILSDLNYRHRASQQEWYAADAKEHPVASSLFSAFMAPMKGLSAIGQVADYYEDGAIDQNAEYNKFSYIPTSIRTQVANDIAQSGKWGEVGSWTYQLGMSMGDFLLTTAASGGNSAISLALMGSGAMADTVISAKDRGLSDDQAMTLGVVAGAAEIITEKFSLDALFNGNMSKGAMRYILTNAFTEGTEEVGSTLINTFADILVSKDKSAWSMEIQEYLEANPGATEREAFFNVLRDNALSLGLDFLGGALMGGIMGIGGAAINYVTNARPGLEVNKNAIQQYGGVTGDLIQEGLESDPKSDSYDLAKFYQKKVDGGKTLTGYQIRSLVEANEAQFAVEDYDAAVKTATERLTGLGESNVNKIAKLVAKRVTGQELSRSEKSTLARSQYGAQVAKEMTTPTEQTERDEKPYGITNKTLADEPITAQTQQTAPVKVAEAPAKTIGENLTVPSSETVPANDRQMTGKLTGEEPSVADKTETVTTTLENASKKYGAQAHAMVHTYQAGQDVAKYDKAYQMAYDMGKSGVSMAYVKGSQAVSYLTDTQKELAYEAGAAASNTEAKELDAKNKTAANSKTERKKGAVRGEGVTIADLKKTFNDPQGKAYKYLSAAAEATGIDIVLYRSEAGADGKFQGAQGRYSRSEPGTLYIDLNAGLSDIKSADDLAKYAMLRTFAHEFTHFIENWNPIQYNELRKVVFDTLTERGENVHDLIEEKQARNPGMSYDKASREVVAEAMTDILPDANFVQELAGNHKTIFQKMLDQLKEFVDNLRDYFNSIGHNPSREANALKEQVGDTIKYLDSIVKLFDNVAVQAVENYQKTVATEETAQEANSNGERKETREAFNRRAHEKEYTVRERGKTACGYAPVTNKTRSAGRTEENLKKLGIQVIVHEGLEANVNGVTKVILGDSTSVAGDAVYVRNSMKTAPMETVGHEAFHFWKHTDARIEYKEIVADNIIFVSDEFIQFQEQIAKAYFGEEVGIEDDGADKLTEEIYAYITGLIHAGDSKNIVRSFLRDYDAVKAAWENLIKKQTVATEEVDAVSETETAVEPEDNSAIPPTEQTEEAKKELRKAVRMPVQGTNMEALLQGIKSQELSMESITLPGNVDGFNDVQREYLVKALIDGVYTDAENIKVAVPYDGKFEIVNTPGNVAKVLDALKVKVTQEVGINKKLAGFLAKAEKVGYLNVDGRMYITNGSVLLAASDNEVGFAKEKNKAFEMANAGRLLDTIRDPGKLLDTAPTEAMFDKTAAYIFDVDGEKMYIDKKLLALVDGDLLYAVKFSGVNVIKSTDLNGNITGIVLSLKYKPGIKITNEKPSKLRSFSKQMLRTISEMNNTTKTNVEVTENGQNENNRATVQQPKSAGRGAAQVLDELQTGDVSGDGRGRDTVADAGERGQQTVRDGDRPDAERHERGHGEGSSQSRDLRGTDRVTSDVEPAQDLEASKKLHEEVVEQIAQQSTELPKGRNFVIGDSLDLPNGEKSRYKANVEAIRLVKQLEAEGRYATEAEQVILSKYVGWGGLANAFDERKTEWSKEFAELKELLTDEEYSSARGSTLNAHYTDISVIKAMYEGLKQLGFTGGRMMEPSSGVGNFVGAMPADMAANVRSWTMVELDGITGLIAKYLYPNADVRIQGFEKAKIPDNFMDVAISNVPFGNYAIADKTYPKKVTGAIHNYFFAKSLDKVRPGGIVMFITSSFTMNSKDSTVRRYIMQRADLLGAIRLPDSAFKGNAGTEVVTDILVLKKRAANTAYAGEDFLEAPWSYPVKGSYNGAYINSYFENHPEMVLGTASFGSGMYRGDNLTYKALEGKGGLADQIREAFKNIQGKMDYPAQLSQERTNFAVERAGKKAKNNSLHVKDGKVYQNKNGELHEVTVAKGAAERISGMLEIRDAAKELITYQQQGLNDAEIKKARQKLNKAYDAFVKKYGFINAPANKNAIKADPDSFSILALENWNPETKKAVKSDVFSKNTIAPNRTVTSAKDVAEGLIVSVNQTGGVDAALIAKLTGKMEADVTRELIDSRAVFKNRNGGLETAEVYLSGNVRAKLRDAEALVHMDSDYQKNVDALKAVMPEDVGYQDIFVNPGTPWIPDSVYSDFAAYMLGTANREWNQSVMVSRNKDTGNFTVELKNHYLKHNSYNTQKWGTNRRTFLDLLDAMLNSKSVVVKDKDSDGKSFVNQDATAAANEKVEAIQKEFQEWLWKDEARRDELATLYNETFNSIVTPKYNGDNLTVNGANAMKPLRPHQRDAVQRVIASGGNTLLAHKVGAGKTYEMAAAAMKLKELGLVKKPLFAVPKSLVAQWGNEFMDFFPTAKLLVAEAGDFTATNRKIFANRIANGDYDAVIVSYEQFEKLPISDDFARELYQEQINSIIFAIQEAKAEKGGKSLSVKDLEKKRKSLQAKIDKLSDSAKDEDNIEFEQLGVDSIFVDEAHNFKNLFYTTSMTNVSGLGNKDGSKRAFDLYTKVRYLQKLNGGRGIVFATATPVMNSMSEMYIMQRYLQPDLLDQLGLSTFDAWAKQFGEVVNGVEIKPSGQGYRVKQSFSRFKNMSELQLLFRNFADVLTDIPGLKIPKMKGGKVNVVVCEPGQFQKDYMKELEKRADNIKSVDPSEDNMLKITSDGRKISYTQRMIDPSLPYEEGCKIYRCADNVVRAYQDSKDIKGTQLIFCDMATPKGKSKVSDTQNEEAETDMESAKLYDDIKARLIKGGIPGKEIAFIHEADTDAKKKKLFADVNDGKVRVLIGSTGKMGVGMNAQKRIVAIHHLDAPWRPGDVEQRNGRAYRQGNINEEVENFTYVTEGSFDARLWDILDRKQNFINQVMNGENVGRETEDTGEVTLSAAEVKALASGSPLIMEQVQLDTDIKKLESLQRAHRSAVSQAREKLEADKGNIEILQKRIATGQKDVAARLDTYSEGKFAITVGKQKFTDKKDAGVALMAEATAKAKEDGYTTIGKFAGFDLRVIKTHEGIKGLLFGNQGYIFNTYPGNTTFMINHLISKVEGIEEAVKLWEHNLSETRKDMAEQEKLIGQPFAKQAELEQKRARYNEVMEILNPKEEQQLSSVDEESVQEQSREYLDDAQQNQQRTNTLTDREVLSMAASEVKTDELTDAEKDALRIFQERLSKLEVLQEERAEQGRLYKEQQFGTKVDRSSAAKTLNRMHTLDAQIQKASSDVLSVEEKTVLKRVLQKARKVVEQQERKHGQEILDRWRDRRNNADAIKKYRERLTKDVNDLTDWVLRPNNKDVVKHIPDVLKKSVIPFLSGIDFTSKQQLRGGDATKADKEFMKRLNGLKAALKPNQSVEGLYADYSDLPPNFMDRLQTLIDSAQAIVDKNSGEFVVNQMTGDELRELSQVVRTLKEYIKNFNKFHVNAVFQHVHEAGDNTISELGQMSNASDMTGSISNFVLWQQMRPAYAWERFGSGGQAIYDGLRRGQAKLAFNTKTITEFSEKAYTEEEVKAWEKEIKEINLGGDIVQMPVSTIMSFYELSKRPQALGHILGQGIRIATYRAANGKKISDTGHTITPGDVQTIIGTLTDRQKEVSDTLQKFMQEQGGKWGNYVSVKRFGEELFGEDHYFPINSDGRHLAANADEHPSAASLYALLNMGFTKSTTEGANNRLVLYSIFDVFANHMASMAQYNAFALPVVDAIKWFNYQQKSEPDEDGKRLVLGSVRDQMDRVYGVPEETRPGSGKQGYAQTFVINILKAFNGTEAQGIPTDTTGLTGLRLFNMAQVAYNFRVVVQQPLAITRAALLIDYGSIIKGMELKPAAIQQNIQEMQHYSGIAAWKSLGFYDVNISRGLTDIIKHSSTVRDKISKVGMWGAEKADTMTWAAIWSACKEEVTKKQHLTPNSEGFYEAVTQLFEDVIYKTQVVDSVLTKNEYMRSKGFFARATGSFMSEPTTTASMLINAYDKFRADIQRGMSKQQAWKNNGKMIVRTAYVYGLSAAILAAVQAAADALRDDDDYQEWYEKWLDAFGGNLIDELMPINKLPLLADFYEVAKELASVFGVDTYGNPPRSVWMQGYDSLIKGVEILYDKASGEKTNYTWYGGAYKLLQFASGIAGLPMAAATREIVTAWNNIVGAMAPSLKVRTYEPGEKNEIKYSYQDGHLTADEAVKLLLEKGLVDTEDEAHWTVQGWEAGEGYSKYDAIYDAVRNGGDFNDAMRELTARGYTEKDVLSQVKSEIGSWYKDGEISKQQAINMLTKHFDMDSGEITATVNKWSCKVVTGIAYEDIGDEYIDGNITATRAIDMYVRYGGYSKEEATSKVNYWTFCKLYPKYEDLFNESRVEKYNKYAKPAGISVDMYAKYINGTKGLSTRNQVVNFIHSLSLTKKQKDALYLAAGYSESKIWDVPW